MLHLVSERTKLFAEKMPKELRKQYGQFFTPPQTAMFMARLFDIDLASPRIRALDAGAGSGILSVALVSHLRKMGYRGEIELVCYETDSRILPLLEENLVDAQTRYTFTYTIIRQNYLTSQPFDETDTLFRNCAEPTYDLVIGNPPYKKIAKHTPEAQHMATVCHGAPNLYFLFAAMGIHNLKAGGELVYIMPRSWTSGAYFMKFRDYLHRHCAIGHIHLFGSRDKVFDRETVLQETLILKLKKTTDKPQHIDISFSETADFSNTTTHRIAYDTIVGSNRYIYLVTDTAQARILSTLQQLGTTLSTDNLKMKTGLIVDFRNRNVLRNKAGEHTYPLFYSQHIKDGKVVWPIGMESEYICTERPGFLQENGNYLFVKRVTAKEERRRLQCGIYIAEDHPGYKYISTQNKINFIKCETPDEVYGLYVLLNSQLYDTYYRILNGSTQVNSTEINNMPFPPRDVIRRMGKELQGQELTETNCNKIVSKWIKLRPSNDC